MAKPSFHALRAKALIHEFLRNELPPPGTVPGPALPEPPSEGLSELSLGRAAGKVAIIGAGVAGLRAAKLLSDAGIQFEILEASDRIGGRLLTHHFSNAQYDYFDVGAMRYPDIPPMKSTFDLFKELGWTPGGPGKLIPYHLSSQNTIQSFNGVTVQGPPPQDVDVFHVGQYYGGPIPDSYAKAGASHWLDKAFLPIVDQLAQAQNEAELLAILRPFDPLSARAYLEGARTPSQPSPRPDEVYPIPVVTWMETFDTGTGLFDQAFSEMCLDYLDFGFPDPTHRLQVPRSLKDGGQWWCIDGGSEVLISAMLQQLTNPKIYYRKRVTKISRLMNTVFVWSEGDTMPTEYTHVISTIPLSCLRTVDLTGADLNYQQKTALRCCHYDSSVKVGIKFTTRWWQTGPNPIVGGSTSTDRFSRTIVYPSYGTANSPGVIIASYTWAQDADREAALIPQNGSMTRDDPLIKLILADLAALHHVNLALLTAQFVSAYAHSWYHDEYTQGAFALYGPAQFNDLYPALIQPAAGGRLHIAGEAASSHHAWIAGSLDSAKRAVAEVLILTKGPKFKAPSEWDLPEDIDLDMLTKQIALSEARFEKRRDIEGSP